jgi:hypothetical protein
MSHVRIQNTGEDWLAGVCTAITPSSTVGLPIADFKCLRCAFACASSFNKLWILVIIFRCFYSCTRGKKIGSFGKPIFYVTHTNKCGPFR